MAQVERNVAGGAEVDGNRNCIIRVDVEARAGQHGFNGDRARLGFADRAADSHAINVELERSPNLLTLKHVLNHSVSKRSVLVRHVDVGAAGAISKASDVAAEWRVLAGGLTDGRHVDFTTTELKGPVTNLGDHGEFGIFDLELVRRDSRASGSNRDAGAAESRGDFQHASCRRVGDHVIGRASRNAGREGAADSAAGRVVDRKLDGIANLEIQEGLNGDFVVGGADIASGEGPESCGGLVVQGAGRAGENGCGHRTKGKCFGRCPVPLE